MLAAIVTVAFFLFTLLAVFAAILLATLAAGRMAKPLSLAAAADGLNIFKQESVSSISAFARLLRGFDFINILRQRMEQAGLDWSPGRVVSMMLLCGLVTFVLGNAIEWLPLLAVLSLTVLAALGPYLYIVRRRNRRLRQFESLFPDCLDSLCRSLRAGHPFAAGMELLASDAPPVIAREIRCTLDEWRLGSHWDKALDNLAERIPLTEVAVFGAAVKLQMRTGGRLGEVLTKLAETMREAGAVQGEVRALAAHGRMTGAILTILPVGIAVMTFVVNPHQLRILIDYPWGKDLITIAIACVVLAHFVIRRIVDVKL